MILELERSDLHLILHCILGLFASVLEDGADQIVQILDNVLHLSYLAVNTLQGSEDG